MKIDIEKLKLLDWQKLVSRPSALLFSSICAEAFSDFKQVSGIDWRVRERLITSEGELFHVKEDLDDLKAKLEKGGIALWDGFLSQLVWHVNALNRQADKLARLDYKKLSDKELGAALNNFLFYAKNAHNFMTPMPLIEAVLTERFLKLIKNGSRGEKRSYWRKLTYCGKENEQIREMRDFLNLVKAYKRKSRRYARLLEAHLGKYAWIGARGYRWDKAWTSRTVEKRLLGYFVECGSPEARLKELTAAKQRAMAARAKITRKLKVNRSKPLCDLVKLAREFAYRRTWRTDVIYRAGYSARGLFYEIARRAKAPLWSVPYLTVSEFRRAAKTLSRPVSRAELGRRGRFYAQAMLGGRESVLSGLLVKRELNPIIADSREYKDRKIITGHPTCPGIVAGRVVIVSEIKDLARVNPGDIIVATMTFPHFISGMEKAAAFITDEGGVLSHAAIISREMGKPCVTGTGFATKALNDGDIVEVNAIKGVVKIVKRK